MSPEVILAYRRPAFDGRSEPVWVGRTSEPAVVLAVARALVAEARREADTWSGVDPTLGLIAAAECERLERVIEAVVGDAEPDLRLVPGREGGPEGAR